MTRRKLFQVAARLAAVGGAISAIWWWRRRADLSAARLPPEFAVSVPQDCRQVLLVLSPEATSIHARLWMMERAPGEPDFLPAGASLPVVLGRSGLAWGIGDDAAEPGPGWRVKYEGDGCSPAGVFRVSFAFGYAPSDGAAGIRIPYVPISANSCGVDDVGSKYYNQVVDSSTVARDWSSDETMLREDGLYRWGAFVNHNPQCVAGAGSCIFLHLWRDPETPTAGCTAMSENDLRRVLEWLDPTANPRLVQGISSAK